MPTRNEGYSALRNPRLSGGFTLVELLVVTAIIAVLIAMFLPVVAKVREQGWRANCLANLNTIHQVLTTYANDHKDQVPLGYVFGVKQRGGRITIAITRRWVNWGLLHQAGLMRDVRPYYCPSIRRPTIPPRLSTSFDFDTTYVTRALVNFGDGTIWPTRFPKLAKLKLEAIVADAVTIQQHLTDRHRIGVNVLYGSGGARWVPIGAFQQNFDRLPNDVMGPAFNDVVLNDSAPNRPPTGIFPDLDAAP
jgi:prepilin-type N-terminal cleavage/methylation domain-containing protein